MISRIRALTIVAVSLCGCLRAQEPCQVDRPTATLTIPHVSGSPPLTTEPDSLTWATASRASMKKDCSRAIDYPNLATEIRAFWTDDHLYLLFVCPYQALNLFLPAKNDAPRVKLWDRDVVEMFLGDDWRNIRHYREFEIAPTGDWIDLAIDLDHQSYDHSWRSGWRTTARIDEQTHAWYAAARIPLKAVSSQTVTAGTRWRMNLYRIEGLGADPQRHFMCWQPTCVQNRDPNHVPENFGTLVFAGDGNAAPADPLTPGRKRFDARCAGCHGAGGMGGERAPAIGRRESRRLNSEAAIRNLIRNGIPDAGMPGFAVPEPELTELVAFVRSRIVPAGQVEVPGDVNAGESYFFGAGQCSGCHMVKGRGGLKGPDLTNVGATLTLAELETALDRPGALRARGFDVATVRLRAGGELRGFIRNESGFDLQLQDFQGGLHFLRSDGIARIERDSKPLMPALAATPDVRRNLLAFLARLPEAGPAAPASLPELPGAVRWDRVEHPERGEWPTYHGNLSGNRHSPLTQIDASNVGKLAPRWIFTVPGARRLEVTPVVVGGVMYVTNVNSVYALDAATGRQVWEYSRPRSAGLVGDASSGINRGVAVLGDRVFLVTDNAHLLALHRVTGALLWDVEMADSRHHYGATSAPLVVGDLVVSGVSGGDEGIRGFVAAYRASTGERVWRFWTIPAPGEPLASTWVGRALEHGCGAAWLTGTYDPETDLLYWVTGNPCPDFNGDERQGDNLYTDSVLALEPRNGELRWHYQFTPHDLHDWDATETPMLVDAEYRGRPRKLLVQGNRNGFFYVLDRVSGEFLSATPFVRKLTWAKGIGSDGRPQLAEGWQPTVEGTRICPSMDGASNWMSTAYDPRTRLFYLMALEKCNIFSKSSEWWKQGQSFYGGAARVVPEEVPKKYLRALDLETGKITWEYPQTGPGTSWGGILSTASGLLFFGDDNGAFTAVDATNGKPLWHCQLNAQWKASPMTYLAGGRQFIAVAAGANIVSMALP